ncbi:MAG: flagellar protein FlgN [Bacillota bacterium]|nr:flagellar protein FlgN [Bacillota bacterium]
MIKILTDIVELLETHKGLYDNLLQLSLSKREALINSKVEEVDNIVSAEQLLIIRIGEIENKRKKAIHELATQLDIDDEKVTFDFVLGLLDEAEKHKFAEIKKSLSGTLNDLYKYNKINTKLIETQLNYISFSYELITGLKQNTAYNRAGTVKHNDSSLPLMDKKV